MADSRPIPRKAAGHELASSLASSFRAGSPIAQEILNRDLAEYSESEDELDDTFRDGSGTESDTEGPTLYRNPAGIAFGYRRPGVLLEPGDDPVLTKVEKKESRNAERSLLRDNHLLPPKHPIETAPGFWSRLYKRVFSTKVRNVGKTPEIPKPTESSPLLGDGGAPDHEHLNQQWEAAVASGKIQTTWQREAKTIAVYSRSLIVTFMLQYSVNIASIFAVGHIGKIELGAVSLATMTANITCYAPFQGLATCLDTLCSQAYGSGHKHLVGLQLQRMTCFLCTLMVPVAILWVFAEDLLLKMIPEARSAELAGLYLKVAIAGIPGFIAFEGGKRFVQAQGLFQATTYVLLIAAPLNVLMNWLFVWHLGWGYVGAPIAATATQNIMPVLLLLYVVLVDGSQCWGGFTKRALANWGPMVRLALPGMLMVAAEWVAFEVLTLVSSQFGTSYLAAQSILVTLASTTYQIPFPISIAASTRVANLIGARLTGAARTSAAVAVYGAALIALCNFALLACLRYRLPLLFTDDAEVLAIVADMLPLVAVMQIFDGLAAMSHGLLRGIGRQHFGGWANLASYYLIALPISFATGLGLDWKLEGLWFGCTVGLFVVAAVEYWYIYLSDWEQSAREAEHRNASG